MSLPNNISELYFGYFS
ncbi:MAG: hypothetical protein JW873_01375 [Candidatus Saganbacteria bacterium]|nr:hypothetical protein [Candidatus Saganbacteria bacterium]